MGRLIEVDVDKVKELLNNNKIELTNNIISIVRENYIPKDQYENRLKADLKAILVELQLEIREHDPGCGWDGYADKNVIDCIIQEKINAIKENADGME